VQRAYFVDRANSEYKVPWNTVENTPRICSPADRAIQTPNSDTPYASVGLDLRAEPVVLVLPPVEAGRYVSVQLIDADTHDCAYLGSRTTGNGGGRFLIAGPGWRGKVPAGIDRVIRCETAFAFGPFRTQLFDAADPPNVARIQQGYSVSPLSRALGRAGPTAGAVALPAPLTPDAQRTDPRFFEPRHLRKLARRGDVPGLLRRRDRSHVRRRQRPLRAALRPGGVAAARRVLVADAVRAAGAPGTVLDDPAALPAAGPGAVDGRWTAPRAEPVAAGTRIAPVAALPAAGGPAAAAAMASAAAGGTAVTPEAYIRAETDRSFANVAQMAGGVNRFHRFRAPPPLDGQTVVRMNKDTLYSAAIVDSEGGATVTLPEPDTDRYLPILVIDDDHYAPNVFDEPGTHRLPTDAKHVMVVVRTQLLRPDDPADRCGPGEPRVLVDHRLRRRRLHEARECDPQPGERDARCGRHGHRALRLCPVLRRRAEPSRPGRRPELPDAGPSPRSVRPRRVVQASEGGAGALTRVCPDRDAMRAAVGTEQGHARDAPRLAARLPSVAVLGYGPVHRIDPARP